MKKGCEKRNRVNKASDDNFLGGVLDKKKRDEK